MATCSIIVTKCLVLTCVALALGLLPACTQARFFPAAAVGSTCKGLISMVTDLGNKIPESPPSPELAPSKHQGTNPAPSRRQGTTEQPTRESWSTPDFQFNSVAVDLGKTGWSPPSPKPAPRKGQEIIEQLIQERSCRDFQVASS
ncbi:hypothetical protein V6N13_048278 [Hibiscus sabdariffa]|uniref:Uncharacterized protein n=1 Tax=Hibiscus sabdariffa TaxID=183260 RepID=A0ABR2F6X3_9ROSI